MRALLATIGSDGDVQPILALAQRLLARGHDVTLAASDRSAARAASLGIPFAPIGPPWDAAEIEKTFVRILAETNPLTQLQIVIESMEEEQRAVVPALMEMARAHDVVVHPPLLVSASAAARAVGTPHVSVHFAPLHRARGYGPTGTNLGPWLNALAWSLAARLLRKSGDAGLNTIVAAAGLPPWKNVLLEASHSQLLDLIEISPSVLPRDPLFPPQSVITGYWFVDEPDFVPDPELAAFVSAEPPVVVGFGSMTGIDARERTSRLLEAVAGLGRRVVLQSGWAGIGEGELPSNVHRAGFVPHAWLFARAACVVHHGGAGTTAAAIRAGVPQAVVWHLGDQLAWGKIVKQLGVGPAPRAHRALDAKWLRKAIERLLGDEKMKGRARQLGEAARKEDGAGVAVTAIEEAVGRAKGKRAG